MYWLKLLKSKIYTFNEKVLHSWICIYQFMRTFYLIYFLKGEMVKDLFRKYEIEIDWKYIHLFDDIASKVSVIKVCQKIIRRIWKICRSLLKRLKLVESSFLRYRKIKHLLKIEVDFCNMRGLIKKNKSFRDWW